MRTRFEWDPGKAKSNHRKHGVRFEMAIRVFADPFALTVQDRIEGNELRWKTVGVVEGFLLLVVAHTAVDDEGDGEVIRIISARRAGSKEGRCYEENCAL
jgi:uncharacterized DUF497 family protein